MTSTANDHQLFTLAAKNYRDLLLTPPARDRCVMGMIAKANAGVRTVIVTPEGQVLEHFTLFPFSPQFDWYPSLAYLAKCLIKHRVNLISYAKGGVSRSLARLLNQLNKMYPDLELQLHPVAEKEALSYGTSSIAGHEVPKLDAHFRAAAYLAKRLQDPLAEIIKLDPLSLPLVAGQQQLEQPALLTQLESVISECIAQVGLDINQANYTLLRYVPGLSEKQAKSIVVHRKKQGPFVNRQQLLELEDFDQNCFQQAAPFLRIEHGDQPLDQTRIHPNDYARVLEVINPTLLQQIIGDPQQVQQQAAALSALTPELKTLVLAELAQPGADPRAHFQAQAVQPPIETIVDLEVGLILKGKVTSVTDYGAFVDIGLAQAGLVHISQLSHEFVDNPSRVVNVGDWVDVKVLNVDPATKKISLSMKALCEKKQTNKKAAAKKPHKKQRKSAPKNTAMADALAQLKDQFGA